MSAGRVQTYTHSDSITPNKGAAMIKVTCQTDFAAKTEPFIDFTKRLAMAAYGANAASWDEIVACWPDAVQHKADLETVLSEKIVVEAVTLLRL